MTVTASSFAVIVRWMKVATPANSRNSWEPIFGEKCYLEYQALLKVWSFNNQVKIILTSIGNHIQIFSANFLSLNCLTETINTLHSRVEKSTNLFIKGATYTMCTSTVVLLCKEIIFQSMWEMTIHLIDNDKICLKYPSNILASICLKPSIKLYSVLVKVVLLPHCFCRWSILQVTIPGLVVLFF